MKPGRIEALFTYPERGAPAVARQQVKVSKSGLQGDRRRSAARRVTVLSLESWTEALRDAGADLPAQARRANVVVSGVDLASALGRRLRLGEVELEIQGEVDPCARMDEAHPGLRRALEPACRGGVHGTVCQPGLLRCGDPVEVLPAPATAFFGQHAAAYATSPGHQRGQDLSRLIELLQPQSTERALDVATGTGHTALALAERCAEVVGLDLTPQMQGPFEEAARQRGLTRVRFQLGDVQRLEFESASFDLATCRRAAHHFLELPKALAELARVLRPGGRLGISDMTTPDAPGAARLLNQLEVLRDPSHVAARSPPEWLALVKAAGLEPEAVECSEELLSWEGWLRPVPALSPESARLEELLARSAKPDLEPTVQEGGMGRCFVKRRLVLLARKPA